MCKTQPTVQVSLSEYSLLKKIKKTYLESMAKMPVRSLPIVSIGPSGIGGEYQTEMG